MKLPKEALEEFKEIYRKEYGKVLDDKQAEAYGLRVIRLLLLAQPIPLSRLKEKFKELFQEEDKISYNYFASKTNK